MSICDYLVTPSIRCVNLFYYFVMCQPRDTFCLFSEMLICFFALPLPFINFSQSPPFSVIFSPFLPSLTLKHHISLLQLLKKQLFLPLYISLFCFISSFIHFPLLYSSLFSIVCSSFLLLSFSFYWRLQVLLRVSARQMHALLPFVGLIDQIYRKRVVFDIKD